MVTPYLGHLRVYGCKAVILDHAVKKGDKFSARGKVGQLVGYESTNIYRIWIPDLHRVVRSTNVSFDEETRGDNITMSDDEDPLPVQLTYPHASSGGEVDDVEETFEFDEQPTVESSTPPQSPMQSSLSPTIS